MPSCASMPRARGRGPGRQVNDVESAPWNQLPSESWGAMQYSSGGGGDGIDAAAAGRERGGGGGAMEFEGLHHQYEASLYEHHHHQQENPQMGGEEYGDYPRPRSSAGGPGSEEGGGTGETRRRRSQQRSGEEAAAIPHIVSMRPSRVPLGESCMVQAEGVNFSPLTKVFATLCETIEAGPQRCEMLESRATDDGKRLYISVHGIEAGSYCIFASNDLHGISNRQLFHVVTPDFPPLVEDSEHSGVVNMALSRAVLDAVRSSPSGGYRELQMMAQVADADESRRRVEGEGEVEGGGEGGRW